MSHLGNCFCGAVKLEVIGSPVAMGCCHCSSCRSWFGGPVNTFSLWNPEAVRIMAGAEHVAISEDGVEPAQILREMRRPPDDQSSAGRSRRCLRVDHSDA
jgi:hypothetical protein